MAADDAGPLEQSWLCQGYRILVTPAWAFPELLAPEDATVPVLLVPLTWAALPDAREVACGFAIAALFEQRYGRVMLQRGMRAWPCLVAQMAERDQETAAD